MPAAASALLIPNREATNPHSALPMARLPWKAMEYAASARVRTHDAEVSWEATLKLDMVEIHAAPAIAIAR